MYDLVIKNGLIVNGTGESPFHGDIAVKDGIIVAVVKTGEIDVDAGKEIDASGMVVTPGFIDIHTHYDLSLIHI